MMSLRAPKGKSPIFKSFIKIVNDSLQKLGKAVCTGKTLQSQCKTYVDDAIGPRVGDDFDAMQNLPSNKFSTMI